MTKFEWPTTAAVITEVLRLAEAEPERVYERPYAFSKCAYVHEGSDGGLSCGCIFGHALANLGVPLHVLRDIDVLDVSSIDALLSGFASDRPAGDDLRLNWCASTQNSQDGGFSWGGAVALADERYPRH